MLRHPKMIEWEDKLRDIFDEIDDYLEDKYQGKYSLHPNRPKRGATSNKSHDGLFNVGTSFTAGYGSAHGRGYVIQISLSTLEKVEKKVRQEIESEVLSMVRERLPKAFPQRELYVEKDGLALKIYGDLSLGHV